jgi:hypothetical protein
MVNKVSNWFYFIFYFIYKLRFIFLALIMGLISFFVFQYWQELNSSSKDLSVEVSDNLYSIVLYYPDRINTGSETKIKIKVNPINPSTTIEKITVQFSINDKYASIEPESIQLSIPNNTKENVQLEYLNPPSPPKSFNFQAKVITKTNTLHLTGNIRIDSNKLKLMITTLFSAIVAILGLIIQIKELLSKKQTTT